MIITLPDKNKKRVACKVLHWKRIVSKLLVK
jgi:hypothetical protein